MSNQPSKCEFEQGTFEAIENVILEEAAKAGDNANRVKGDLFEQLVLWYLTNAPEYRGEFAHVWMWDDWPDKPGPDQGIDLVAETTSGELWAIQAKAHDPKYSVKKSDIDSFLSDSNTRQFSCRLLIATTDNIGANGRKTIDEQEKPVRLMLRGQLLRANVRWPDKIGESPEQEKSHEPLPYQKIAIKDVLEGFEEHAEGKLIMACGTGKTLVSQRVDEAMKNRRTLYIVPTISLLDQIYKAYKKHGKESFRSLVVCSDKGLAGSSSVDADPTTTKDLSYLTHDKAEVIKEFLEDESPSKSVVFSTYHSLPLIAEAQSLGAPAFDLVVADEAHRTVSLKYSKSDKQKRFFTLVHDRANLKAFKRLYMTATPRFINDAIKKKVEDLGEQVVDMSDEAVFGKDFHKLTFGQAIKDGILADYRLVSFTVTEDMVRQSIDEAALVSLRDGGLTDARYLAALIGLGKAIKKHDLTKILTFHSRVKGAKRIAEAGKPESFFAVNENLLGDAKLDRKIWTRWITAEKTVNQRESIFNAFEKLPPEDVGIISNCACLGEGVDIPELDGVVFIDPRQSIIDIIQAVGRVIRKKDRKGTIVVPVFANSDEGSEDALNKSDFATLWYVIRALRAHDEVLAEELDALRTQLGKRVSRTAGRNLLPDKLILDSPAEIPGNFANEIYASTIEEITTLPKLTESKIIEWAIAYNEEHGEWPSYKAEGEIPDSGGETWVGVGVALRVGGRGLPGKTSLANLLHELGYKKNHLLAPRLTESMILSWMDEHHRETGKWPIANDGEIKDSGGENWKNIESALINGGRGLSGGSSIAKLRSQNRGVRSKRGNPPLTEENIFRWVVAFYEKHGFYPKQKDINQGRVENGIPDSNGETWKAVISAMQHGLRGLAPKTLGKLMHESGLKKNRLISSQLNEEKILELADKYFDTHGMYPSSNSKPIAGPEETWGNIEYSLRVGSRGLPGNDTLAKLLDRNNRKKNMQSPPDLKEETIIGWIENYFNEHKKYPTSRAEVIPNSDGEKWKNIDYALNNGKRGLLRKITLAKLIAENKKPTPKPLTPKQQLVIDQIIIHKITNQREIGEAVGMHRANVSRLLKLEHVMAALEAAESEQPARTPDSSD